MNLIQRIDKERFVLPLMAKGFSRRAASLWYGQVRTDKRENDLSYSAATLHYWRTKGYLSTSIRRYQLEDAQETDYISDVEYLLLRPYNNSFSKWLEDMITTQRVLRPDGKHFRRLYFSIIQRERAPLILRTGQEDRPYTAQDVESLIRDKRAVELRPAYWGSSRRRYLLTCGINEESGEECFYANGETECPISVEELIAGLQASYVISDPVPLAFDFGDGPIDHKLAFWVANDVGEEARLLHTEITLYWDDEKTGERRSCPAVVGKESGMFAFAGRRFSIPCWHELCRQLLQYGAAIPQISYYSFSIALAPEGDYTFLYFTPSPKLPDMAFDEQFNNYLKTRFKTQFRKKTVAYHLHALRDKLDDAVIKVRSRKGMRPYMYQLWRESSHSDLLHTKGVSLPAKLWAHRHGFLSFRIYQYGLTRSNYKQFLSDYDYHWLNRINNGYQKWVNDKTTYRYVMEPFKEHVPQYYFSVFSRNGETLIRKIKDCPAETPEGFEGLLAILKEKKKLAFKASAGTHGDGFYFLSCTDGEFRANGKPCTEDELRELVTGVGSFYVVTEYLEMHRDLKKIYADSVNTVRVMVVNEHGYDPRILQTYMRIGSSKTGFTDNVGYGGICAFVNKDTGEIYHPETIKNHVFYDCPVHPDTGVPISGVIPNWEVMKSRILEICRYFCELEYLGFDVTITDEGFQILEINIHQDLHKVATFDEEMNAYFRRLIMRKYEQYYK